MTIKRPLDESGLFSLTGIRNKKQSFQYDCHMQKPAILLILGILFRMTSVHSQTVSLEIGGTTQVDFTFNTIQKLQNGIVIPNALLLNIEATGTNWDLYAGSVTATAGYWDNIQYYGASQQPSPPIDILSMRAYNLSNTQQTNGFVPIQDIATSTLDIIGNHLSPDPSINCSDFNHVGTNTPGTFSTDPQCYQFKVDLKITPGINYRPGIYTLQIVYIIAADL